MAPTNQPTVPERLRALAALYEQRSQTYGASYWVHGPVMKGLFPDPLVLTSGRDHTRMGLLTMIVGKLTRYCQRFQSSESFRASQLDSLRDLAVYAMMLAEVDEAGEDSP